MNKTAIKNYAIWARTKLIEDIKYKAGLLGISEKEIAAPLAQSTNEVQYFAIGTRNPYAISGVQIAQRASLANAIKRKAQEVDYKTAYNQIVEEVAYTWFNRFIAVRFMDVNEYLPCKIRVLSAVDGRQEPDIVQNPFDAKLDYTPSEENLITQYQLNNEGDKLFNLLFIKVCNDLSKVLPQLFEAEDDYTELLLNISYTDRDGLIYKLVHDIPEEDFNIDMGGQVEIIGWLYQYYNTEPKNETFALLKKNVKITKERIPSATQLFTPDWIVRYMVENSLGRMWVDGHPNDFLKSQWKYYLEEAEQEESVKVELAKIREQYAQLQPEDIKIIDPCMGSGHILVYAFEVLMQIYTQMGYTDKDAALSILENNLYGLDIDKRSFQLAYFAVLMKARQYHKFILKKQPQCHIYAIAESNGINMKHLAYFGAQLDELAKPVALNQMQELIATLHDTKEYGSIISVADYDWDLLHQFAAEFDISGEMNLFDSFGIEATQQRLQEFVDVGEVLAQKYEVVVTNPPYMGGGSMSAKLSNFVKVNFADSKSDLFAVFMEVCHKMNANNGYQAMITQHAWMFLSSFEKLRAKIQKLDIVNMAHLGARAFEEIGGEVVQTTSFILSNKHVDGYKGTYCRLVEPTTQQGKEEVFLAKENRYVACSDNFAKIPGAPIAYWVSKKMINAFSKGASLKTYGDTRQGMATSDNNRFLRLWYETLHAKIGFSYISAEEALESHKKWFPYNKGGSFRKWYGNMDYVINYENDGFEVKQYASHLYKTFSRTIKSISEYFKPCISWSKVTSADIAFRYYPKGFVFDVAGCCIFYKSNDSMNYDFALLNSVVAKNIFSTISPTLNYETGHVASLPIIKSAIFVEIIDNIVDSNIERSKSDWDSFETSWDFQKHPLMPQMVLGSETVFIDNSNNLGSVSITSIKLQDEYDRVKDSWKKSFLQLKSNEEELNRIFIDIYGLQGELTPEVEEKDVTIHRIFDSKEDVPESMKGSNYVLTKQDVVKSLLSYAVGCMFGRYSLDVEGLAYAGGEWDASKYARFIPDPDNVIPITDEDYFEDDIVGRFVEWLKVVYGKETLEENLRFVADALGGSGDTPRQRIRNYFLKDFFKDHCKTYQKRPIYWLYDSGKQNGFKALIYMHRYNKDTTGQVRAEYLGRMEGTYESEINRMEDIKNNGKGREVALAAKRIEKLKKQLKECRDYDEYIGHLALAAIDIDLDDGVKVNYVKVQTAKDGKVLPLLAKI